MSVANQQAVLPTCLRFSGVLILLQAAATLLFVVLFAELFADATFVKLLQFLLLT